MASFSGTRASWKALDESAIRLEYSQEGEARIAELRLGDVEDGKRTAMLDMGGVGARCVELESP